MITPKINSTSYPEFIRTYFENSKVDITKVFPKIGLENYTDSFKLVDVPNIEASILAYLKNLSFVLSNERANQRQRYSSYYSDRVQKFINVCDALTALLNNEPSSFIKKENNKINLILPKDLVGYTKGTNITDIISHMRAGLFYMERLDDLLGQFNTLKYLQLDDAEYSIVFSGDGDTGLWDIATMSMRGIVSCQRWDRSQAKALIGSMVDPYAGIIYLTDNFDGAYGKQMVRRSVVRLVFNNETNAPAILIERVYPHDYSNGVSDVITFAVFSDFIKQKTKNKFPIVYGDSFDESQKYFIPVTPNVEYLSREQLSYRDSKIAYKSVKNLQDISNISF